MRKRHASQYANFGSLLEVVLPSALESSTMSFLGHAFIASQVFIGQPDSSSRLTVTTSRWMVFSFTLLIQSHKALSFLKIPFFEDRRNGRGLWIRYLMFERILEWLKGLAV